jgi:probable addiction module antidote protein
MAELKVNTSKFDISEHLKTTEDIANYLDALLEEGNDKAFNAGLGHIARALGMAQIAEQSGLGRTSLYKALSEEGNPEFSTVVKVARSMGVKFVAVPIDQEHAPA